jgi:hypothetical protein
MDCQAITLGEHLLWEVLFKSFGYKKWATLGSPIFIGWVKAAAPDTLPGGCNSVCSLSPFQPEIVSIIGVLA